MDELQNPHDRFVRAVWSQTETAASFFAHYLLLELVARLDLATLEVTQESFVDEALRAHHTDLLYQVRLADGTAAFIYLLLEHKSAVDSWVALQLFRYLARLWNKEQREGAEHLPPVIPLVLYHGNRRWPVSTQFADLVTPSARDWAARYTPHFEYHLCDLSHLSDSELRGIAVLQTALSLLKHIFSNDLPQRLAGILRLLRQIPEQSALEFLATALRYVSAANPKINETNLRRALTQAFPAEEGGVMTTLAAQWVEQGIQQGVQQGIQQGVQRGRAEQTLRFLQRRFGILEANLGQRVHALTAEALERFGDDSFDFQSASEITDWLDRNAGDTGLAQ